MSYLQLAESGRSIEDFYIPIPTESGIKMIREDLLDEMPENQYQDLMEQLDLLNMLDESYLSGKAEREARRALRLQRKQARIERLKTSPAGSGFKSIIESITGAVSGAGDMSGITGTETETTSGGSKKWLLIGGGVALIAILALTMGKKKKGKKA